MAFRGITLPITGAVLSAVEVVVVVAVVVDVVDPVVVEGVVVPAFVFDGAVVVEGAVVVVVVVDVFDVVAAASLTTMVASAPMPRFFAASSHNTDPVYDPDFMNLYADDAIPLAIVLGIFATGVLPREITIAHFNPVSPASSLTDAENVVTTPVVVSVGESEPTVGITVSVDVATGVVVAGAVVVVDGVVVFVFDGAVVVVDGTAVSVFGAVVEVPGVVVFVLGVAGAVVVVFDGAVVPVDGTGVVVVLDGAVVVPGVVASVVDAFTTIVTDVPVPMFPALSLHVAAAPKFPAALNVNGTDAVMPVVDDFNDIGIFSVVPVLFVSKSTQDAIMLASVTVEESVTTVPTIAEVGLIAPITGAAESMAVSVFVFVVVPGVVVFDGVVDPVVGVVVDGDVVFVFGVVEDVGAVTTTVADFPFPIFAAASLQDATAP